MVLAGLIDLQMTLGTGSLSRTEEIEFTVVRLSSVYNTIVGHISLMKFQVVVSIYHLKMKFLSREGVGEVRGQQEEGRACYAASVRSKSSMLVVGLKEEGADLEVRDPATNGLIEFEKRAFAPFENMRKKLYVEDCMTGAPLWEMEALLGNSRDGFAWTADDLKGVPRDVVQHTLNINLVARPVS